MNVPGARRVSKSRSSILEASKAVKIDLQLKQNNPDEHYDFGNEIARYAYLFAFCTAFSTSLVCHALCLYV